MPKFNVNRSIVIDKKVDEVYQFLNNFENWQSWSPWDIAEDGINVTISDDKKSYAWKGDITGEGKMTITNEKENELIECDLQFLKPMRTKSKIGFKFETEEEGTRVYWWMEGKLPFFLFWMIKKMEGFISMDYDRGLKMLKEYAETGEVPTKLNVIGEKKYPGCEYIGLKCKASLDNIGEVNKNAFIDMMGYLREKNIELSGAPFTIYHGWDVVNRTTEFTIGAPVSAIPKNLPSQYITGQVPSMNMYGLEHVGAYRHIGNAWASMQMRSQSKKFKMNKKVDPMEVYLNSPLDTEEKKLKTEVLFAVK